MDQLTEGRCPVAVRVDDAAVEAIGPFMRVVHRDRHVAYIDDNPEVWVEDEEQP